MRSLFWRVSSRISASIFCSSVKGTKFVKLDRFFRSSLPVGLALDDYVTGHPYPGNRPDQAKKGYENAPQLEFVPVFPQGQQGYEGGEGPCDQVEVEKVFHCLRF